MMGMPAACMSPTALREASTSFARNRKSLGVLLARLSARPCFQIFWRFCGMYLRFGSLVRSVAGVRKVCLIRGGRGGDGQGWVGWGVGWRVCGFFGGVVV